MKLSEMTTERAADALCELTPYIAAISTDEELMEEIRSSIDPKKAANRAELMVLGAEKLSRIVPILLKKRRAELFGILSVLNLRTPEQIAKQNILITMGQVRDMVKDRELVDFFKSCASTEEKAEKE